MQLSTCRFFIAIFMTVVLLAACAATPPTPESEPTIPGALKRSEILELFFDKTVESVTVHKGRVSHSYYSPSGEVRQMRNGQRRFGHWRVNANGRICLQMEESKEKCRIIVKEADGSYQKYIVKKSGEHEASVGYRNFVDGNPNKL